MDLEGRQKPTFDTHQIAAIINGSKRSHSGYHLLLNFFLFQTLLTSVHRGESGSSGSNGYRANFPSQLEIRILL